METTSEKSKTGKTGRGSKGGRPKKREHLDQKITVMCSRFDLITIRFYAKELNLKVSEYLA